MYCIETIHLDSTSRSARQSEALPLTCLRGTDAVVLQSCQPSLFSIKRIYIYNCLTDSLTPERKSPLPWQRRQSLPYKSKALYRAKPIGECIGRMGFYDEWDCFK